MTGVQTCALPISADAIQEGDTITIPADTKTGVRSFAEKPFVDQNDNVLGSWEYKSGEFILKFSGEYIKNNYITTFTAHFRTGNIGQHPVIAGRIVNLGERKAFIGKLGKDEEAFRKGALAALVSRPIDGTRALDLRSGSAIPEDQGPEAPFCILVEDSLLALQKIAAWHRSQLKP